MKDTRGVPPLLVIWFIVLFFAGGIGIGSVFFPEKTTAEKKAAELKEKLEEKRKLSQAIDVLKTLVVEPSYEFTFGGLKPPEGVLPEFHKDDQMTVLGNKTVWIDRPIYMGKETSGSKWYYYVRFNAVYNKGEFSLVTSEDAIVPGSWLKPVVESTENTK